TYAISHQTPSLEELIGEVKQGEEIILTDHGQAVAKIIPFKVAEKAEMAQPGLWKDLPGKFWMSADFDEPLEDFKEHME
ncbi:MAG: type II toxin-antitoxin system Phd/YefM family antitoxin, partial [Candidatus Methylumidiphilus sp.]